VDRDKTEALDPGAHGLLPGPLLDPARLEGEVLDDKYRIDELIGKGGMAYVYRGHHLKLDRAVAVKVLSNAAMERPLVTRRFEREARAVSRLSHPNVLHVTDFGTAQGGIPYLVMELIEGDELSKYTGKAVSPAEVVGAAVQILRGLQHAHERGVVHRDLKPSNVFVANDHAGRPVMKIVDFGISKLADADPTASTATRTGMVFGTPKYMSPEQATGADDVDGRADLYSLGVVMYEMLAGHPPFTAQDAVALLRKHVTETPPPLPDRVPSALRSIVSRLLAKDRNERFQDAGDVLRAIQPRGPDSGDDAPGGPGIPGGRVPQATPIPDAAAFARAFDAAIADAPAAAPTVGQIVEDALHEQGGRREAVGMSAPIGHSPVDVSLDPLEIRTPSPARTPSPTPQRSAFSEGPLLPTIVGLGALAASAARGYSLYSDGATTDDLVLEVGFAGLGTLLVGFILVALLRRLGL
jgi:serine/threonine protein kinase